MKRHTELLESLLNNIEGLDGSFDKIIADDTLTAEEKIGIICESVIDDMNHYLIATALIKD